MNLSVKLTFHIRSQIKSNNHIGSLCNHRNNPTLTLMESIQLVIWFEHPDETKVIIQINVALLITFCMSCTRVMKYICKSRITIFLDHSHQYFLFFTLIQLHIFALNSCTEDSSRFHFIGILLPWSKEKEKEEQSMFRAQMKLCLVGNFWKLKTTYLKIANVEKYLKQTSHATFNPSNVNYSKKCFFPLPECFYDGALHEWVSVIKKIKTGDILQAL